MISALIMMTRYQHPPLRASFIAVTLLLMIIVAAPPLKAAADPSAFPIFESIRPNIAFWEKIYSTYSVTTAIIHDQEDLSLIYGTVTLLAPAQHGSRKANQQKIDRAKKHYTRLLQNLAANGGPRSAEEKRLATLFGNRGTAEVWRRAAGNVRAQTGLKERFREGVVRSGAYMTEIRRIFKKHGLPPDLAYLPHVESSFNPKAFSKFGASGMWQFTRETGKRYLRIDYIVDERRDPLIAAEAAARLLKDNYRILESWPLALTAYNYGTAGMKRARAAEGSYERIFNNYRQGYFKFASRNFYSEFIAAVSIAKQLERSGSIVFERPLPVVTVKLPAFADAERLAAHLGLDSATLRRYNPALRDPVFEGTKYIPKDHLLKLPHHLKNSRLLAGAPASIFKAEQKRSQFYQVKPGDTAGAIAQAHKISVKQLIDANQLNRQALIRVGQNLRIPSPGNGPDQRPRLAGAATGRSPVILKDLKKSLPAETALPSLQDAAVSGDLQVSGLNSRQNLLTGTIEIQPDESVGLLADWLRSTPEAIRLINSIPADRDVVPGQEVKLEFVNVTVADFEAARFDFHQETQEDFFNSYTVVGLTTYEVLEGDTVWDICYKKFDLPLWLLKKYNDQLDFNRLNSTSNLHIPILREI